MSLACYECALAGSSPVGTLSVSASVRVQGGILYFGGNRFSAPMTLAFVGRALTVNGMAMPPETMPSAFRSVATSTDTPRDLLDKAAVRKVRDDLSRGLSMRDALLDVRDLYDSSQIVRSVAADSTGLWVSYVDRAGPPNRKAFPQPFPMRDPTPQEIAQRNSLHAYEMLQAFKRHLDGGGMLIHLRHREIYIPAARARFVDGALQKLLARRTLTPTEVKQLSDVLPRDRWDEVSQQTPLSPAR